MVLADTGPLYAAEDPDDERHGRSQEDLARLEREGFVVMIAYPVLCEAYGLLLRRLPLRNCHDWLEEVTDKVGLIQPAPDDYLEAARLARRYSDQTITLFDAVAAVLSGRLELSVWTYDHHFDVMWVWVWR